MSHAPDAATLNPLADRGRAKQRDRRILLSILAGMPFRLLQIGSGVLLVPLAVRYLGTERFGLWAAITALAPIVALAALGTANGLINAVAATMARDDTALICPLPMPRSARATIGAKAVIAAHKPKRSVPR